MMKRLAERSLDYCTQHCPSEKMISCAFYKDDQAERCLIANMYDRLAAYEDTGLTPAQIKYILPKQSAEEAVERMKTEKQRYVEWFAWKQAEQEGRLVVLPCKVGDTVWDTEGLTAEPSRHIVLGFDVLRSLNMAHLSGGQSLPVSEFGKTWFLTRSEAEAALKGVSEDA